MKAAAAEPAKPIMPLSMHPLTKAAIAMRAKIAMKVAMNTLQPIEMTFMKVFDTIDSSISLSVLELKCFLYIQRDLVQVLRFGSPEARDLRP